LARRAVVAALTGSKAAFPRDSTRRHGTGTSTAVLPAPVEPPMRCRCVPPSAAARSAVSANRRYSSSPGDLLSDGSALRFLRGVPRIRAGLFAFSLDSKRRRFTCTWKRCSC
jgi:hypothetical protein